ncbi:MAG: TetR/AcrR family transcriptional regulator [Parasporobacterium sp.]|nr:TetR/AcrR family transcriptional regulator [Parasporobacterium sp.]
MKNRKQEIIQAALELAAENGLGTVSMQQIADKLGIKKASLYNHFSSRDEIIEAMYELLREESKRKTDAGEIDYDALTADRSMSKILTTCVNSYREIVTEPQMFLFYKLIMSERSINSKAAEIMVRETKTMINATKAIFYALQVKGVADFKDADTAAFSFAMAVHAILEYEFDLKFSGNKSDHKMMESYINEFCRNYQK